jgi:hypothetical protein
MCKLPFHVLQKRAQDCRAQIGSLQLLAQRLAVVLQTIKARAKLAEHNIVIAHGVSSLEQIEAF